jgi:crossover junction endodeoxyribonuclease RusA
MGRLVIDLPWPQGLFPNQRLPDWQKTKLIREHRQYAYLLTRSALATMTKRGEPHILPEGDIPLWIIGYPKPSGKIGDDDNLISACKAGRDGIAEALRIDDKRFITQPVEWRARRQFGALKIEIGA